MAPTAEQEQQDTFSIEARKSEPLFFSKTQNLRIVLAQELAFTNVAGQQITQSPGFVVEFENGYLKVTERLERLFQMFRDRFVHLYDNPDLQDAESIADYLRAKATFNSQGLAGFVEIKPSVPDAAPVVMEIAEAMLEGDVDKITSIYMAEIEEDGWRRQPVIDNAVRALERLEGEVPANIQREPEPQEPSPEELAALEGTGEPVDPGDVLAPHPGALEEAVAEAEQDGEEEPPEPAREQQGPGFYGGPPGSEE